MPSQILEIPKISPITPGAIRSTSVENFIRYMLTRKNMNPMHGAGDA